MFLIGAPTPVLRSVRDVRLSGPVGVMESPLWPFSETTSARSCLYLILELHVEGLPRNFRLPIQNKSIFMQKWPRSEGAFARLCLCLMLELSVKGLAGQFQCCIKALSCRSGRTQRRPRHDSPIFLQPSKPPILHTLQSSNPPYNNPLIVSSKSQLP